MNDPLTLGLKDQTGGVHFGFFLLEATRSKIIDTARPMIVIAAGNNQLMTITDNGALDRYTDGMWARPELDRGFWREVIDLDSPCESDVITRLDHGPPAVEGKADITFTS